MATALQKQLASIQATRKNELDLKAQKASHAKSLLFEPKIAAAQSFDVLYQLAREGFQDLCQLDARFTKFSNSLFSPASKNQDRNLMTERENLDLDNVLDDFLGLVGARLLLKPAQHAVEWLVRRFQVHERNSETLILTFIPYHANPIFLTLLSILPKQLPASLRFLYRYANTFSNPPRDALVQAAVQNHSFFAAMNAYVLHVSRNGFHYPALISLWASIVAQSIDTRLHDAKSGLAGIQRQKTSDILTNVLPVLNDALSVKRAAELVVGCHMILIILVGKLELDDFALDAIMSAVALSLSDDSRDTGLACLSLMAERRTSLSLPKSVLRVLLETPNLVQSLETLSREQNVRKLSLGLASTYAARISEKPLPEALTFFKFLVRSNILPQDEKHSLSSSISEDLLRRQINLGTVDEVIRKQIEQITNELHSFLFHGRGPGKALDGPPVLGLENWEILSSSKNTDQSSDLYLSAINHMAIETGVDLKEDSMKFQNTSFLLYSDAIQFEHLALAFETASSSKENLDDFIDLPIFRSATSEPSLPLFTFLARFWCSQYSATSRCTALRLIIDRMNEMRGTHVDMQILLPYALCALADTASNVRGKAAEFMTVFSESNTSSATSPWGFSVHNYAGPTKTPWLSAKDLTAFMKQCVLRNLEESISDSNHIGIALRQAFERRFSGHSQTKDKSLKREQKIAIFNCFSVAARHNEGQNFRLRFLQLLNTVSDIAGTPRSEYLLPCFKDFVERIPHHEAMCSKDGLQSALLISEMVRTVSPEHYDAVIYLCGLATDELSNTNLQLQDQAFLHLQRVWLRIPSSTITPVVNSLVRAALSTTSNSSRKVQAASLLKHVSIIPKVLVSLINEALFHEDTGNSPLVTKKRRTSKNSAPVPTKIENEENVYLNKLTLVMEIVEASKARGNLELFQSMSQVLQELQSYGVQAHSDLAFVTNLTLTTMANNMQVLSADPESRQLALGSVRPDLLVDCIRNTSSPQNRNSALLILSFLAKQAPQTVLQSVMPIFTMMSATTARLSDEFSAHVVDQTIQDVMPVLVRKLHEEEKDLVSATSGILLSFAAAFDHIPPHRRLQLFKLLATSLGAEETLFAIITALVDAYPANDEVSKFTTTLCRQFGSSTSMTTVSNVLLLILQALSAKTSRHNLFNKLTQENAPTIGLEHTVQNLMQNVLDLLSDQAFQQELQSDLKSKEKSGSLEDLLRISFENIFKILHQTQQSLKQKPSQILERLLSLFPFESMAASIQPLLSHSDDSVCESLLGTLEAKIRASHQANKTAKAAILGLLPALTAMLQDENRSRLRLSVLSCIDQICEDFGKTNPNLVFETIKIVAGDDCLGNSNPQIQTVSLYCLASSLEVLRDDFIPLLKSVEKSACSSLAAGLSSTNEKLHNAAIAFFMSLTDIIPYMISEECLQTLLALSQQSALSGFTTDAHHGRSQMLVLFAQKLEVSTTARLLVQVLPQAVAKGPVVVQDLLDMSVALVDSHDKSTISRNARDFFGLFLVALDLRRKATAEANNFPEADVKRAEQSVIGALVAMILKINDTIFRPFFVELLEWSSAALSKRDMETKTLRSITIFNLMFALSERLKSIFTPYYGYALERASESLQDSQSSIDLKRSILGALTSSFKHDSDDFWQSPSHFEPIVESISAQFAERAMQKVQDEVIQAFTELGVAATSNEHHKDMNGRLLKLFRSDSSRTRMAAVRCQLSLTGRLGDEWLSNLPEMLPSINELQEDDDEEVERETQRWIKLIEDKLGESLNAMLQ